MSESEHTQDQTTEPLQPTSEEVVSFNLSAGWHDLSPSSREIYIKIDCDVPGVMDTVSTLVGSKIVEWMNAVQSAAQANTDQATNATSTESEQAP